MMGLIAPDNSSAILNEIDMQKTVLCVLCNICLLDPIVHTIGEQLERTINVTFISSFKAVIRIWREIFDA